MPAQLVKIETFKEPTARPQSRSRGQHVSRNPICIQQNQASAFGPLRTFLSRRIFADEKSRREAGGEAGVILAALALLAAQNQSGPPEDRPSTPVAPPGWEYVAQTVSRSHWFLNRVSMSASYLHDATVRVWIRIDHSQDRTVRERETRGLL